MAFKKGDQRINRGGRPKGAKNRVNEELRQSIAEFLNGEFSKLKADFKKIPARDRMKFFTDLLPYTVPKLQNTRLEIDFEKMTDEQLDYFIDKLKTNEQAGKD